MKIKKKLFACGIITSRNFFCIEDALFLSTLFPLGPTSDVYVPCTATLCPLIDESKFAVQIFKDVATIRDLTPQGTPVNLDKFHYKVTESQPSSTINFGVDTNLLVASPDKRCFASGFSHTLNYQKLTKDLFVNYDICVIYVGDCEGTIHPGEVKTCTVENYIVAGQILYQQNPNDNVIKTTTHRNYNPIKQRAKYHHINYPLK